MKNIILASESPRRRDILDMFGLKYEVLSSDIEEKMSDDEEPEQIVMALALQKALDVESKVDDQVIIAADTIVYGSSVMGKPSSEKEAFEMLKALSGTEHYVYTGFAVVEANTSHKVVDYAKTKVKMKNLSDEQIKRYVASGEPMGKAGAYAIQGIGAVLVESIEGDFFNVVGLPVSKLHDVLEQDFGISLY